MQLECLQIRKELKEIIKRRKFGKDIDSRSKSLCSQLFRLQDSLISLNWIREVLNGYRQLMISYSTSDSQALLRIIQNLEDQIISNLLSNLRIPQKIFNNLLQQSRNESSNQSIDIILPKFLSLIINQANKNNLLSFMDFWTNEMLNMFFIFQIPFNDFGKCVAKKALCPNPLEPDNTLQIDPRKIESFMQLFFGNIKNYKFYSKISRIYSEIFEPMSNRKWAQEIQITLTFLRLADQEPHTFELGQKFEATPVGLKTENCRGDGLIIFGRHPHSDIVFPTNEKLVDLVALIIYNSETNYYAVDCSTKKGAYCGIKIHLGIPLILTEYDLISLAKTVLFQIDKIGYENVDAYIADTSDIYEYKQPGFKVYPILRITCVEGPYANQKFIITTQTSETGVLKEDHIFGCDGTIADFFIPKKYNNKETGISARHLTLIFKNDTWSYLDIDSSNGTFLLMKNNEEYQSMRNSTNKALFNQNFRHAIILVSGYIFNLCLI